MPSDKKPPVSDLSILLKRLLDAQVEFILVGGLAAAAQGAPITTFDLDIVHRLTDENLDRLMKFLKSVDAYQRRPDDKVILANVMDFHSHGQHLLVTKYGPLDVLSRIEKNFDYDLLLPLTVEIEFGGRKVRVLSLEGLINLKEGATELDERYRLDIYKETLRQLKNE
jgi:predicted nucleotidyltransferase